MSSFKESFRVATQSIRRSSWLTATSVAIMGLTFFTTSLFVSSAVASNLVLKFLESKAQITAFFKDDASEEQIMSLKGVLEVEEDTSSVNYISKEDALQIYLGQHQDEPALLESISANIFPASLDIRARDIDSLPDIAKRLESEVGVEEVVFYEDVVENFRKFARVIRWGGIITVAVLSLVSLSIVLVTIGISIHSRAEEIEIMRLVGATPWYIRLPFLIQGAAYGALGALLSSVVFMALLPLAYTKITPLLSGLELAFLMPLSPVSFLFLGGLLLGEIVLGALIGVGGSFAAVYKYLKE